MAFRRQVALHQSLPELPMASGDTQHMKRYEPARSELIDSNQPRAQLQAQVREVSAIPADRLKRSSPNTHSR